MYCINYEQIHMLHVLHDQTISPQSSAQFGEDPVSRLQM